MKLGACSNGEFSPAAPSEIVRETVRRARRMCEENARRIGMDRRRFLLSSMGAATTLLALGACSSESNGGQKRGGSYRVDEDAMVDPDVALDALGDSRPVIDMQTHLLEYPPDWSEGHLLDYFRAAYPPEYFKDCDGVEDLNDCFGIDAWRNDVLVNSDTTLAVLSATNVLSGDPLSAEVMDRARRVGEELCGDGRVLVQGHAWPNVGELGAALDAMEAEAGRYDIAAWKTYTHTPPAYSLDDHAGLAVGEAFLTKVKEIGPPIVCVHKGFSEAGDRALGSPADIGPAASNHPDLTFCVYHAGFEVDVPEGPYDASVPNGGVDRLVKTLEDHDIGHAGNVYAELGSVWRFNMADLDALAHILGKLLVGLGEDRILWGTDCIWYGSPQDQIQTFRSFEISEQFQEQYGYPGLTDEIKQKILWRNAARLLDVDVAALPCRTPEETEDARVSGRRSNLLPGPRTAAQARAVFRAGHPWLFRG